MLFMPTTTRCRARLELKKTEEKLGDDEFDIDEELRKMLEFERQRRENKVTRIRRPVASVRVLTV